MIWGCMAAAGVGNFRFVEGSLDLNYQLLKIYINAIPNSDGTPSLLNDFIEACDGLIISYSNNNNNEQNKFLFRTIKNKLKGQSQINISTRLEVETWSEIKQILIRTLGDPRDIDTI